MRTHADQLRERLSRMLPDVPSPALPDVHPQIGLLLARARAAFSQGFQKALRAPPEALPQLLRDEPFQTRGFALEGAAMAATLLDEFDHAHGGMLKALLTNRSAAEYILCAIGVGWASARLGRTSAWSPPELHSQYMSAVADGYGFHQGFFHSYRFEGRGFPREKGELSKPYDAGLGRALWFIHLGRVEPIARAIESMSSDRRTQFWRGVGTACAFTDSAEYAATQMGAAAVEFKSHFWAGLETGTQLLRALAPQSDAQEGSCVKCIK
ncbi:MAG: DUF1702 family protein [Gammaproteobacteria bacterium]|nr:DUF1702 family protein [Gammaproteobacteria bacterium]MCI0692263.1 DUF1702 family protein [candidate division KSB1 bacterium]